MSVKFKTGWDNYIRGYSKNQPYLDQFTENDILSAMGRAYMDRWFGAAGRMFRAACDVGGDRVTVEQGPHQPEDMAPFGGDGFCLHVTARHRGRAFHLYIQQNERNGRLEVIDVT